MLQLPILTFCNRLFPAPSGRHSNTVLLPSADAALPATTFATTLAVAIATMKMAFFIYSPALVRSQTSVWQRPFSHRNLLLQKMAKNEGCSSDGQYTLAQNNTFLSIFLSASFVAKTRIINVFKHCFFENWRKSKHFTSVQGAKHNLSSLVSFGPRF